VFNAKGAVFILAWDSALGIVQRGNPRAEGATHSGASSIIGAVPRTGWFVSRFTLPLVIQ